MNPNEGAPNKKTRFDEMASEGPEYLAVLLALTKITAMEKLFEKFGISYECSDRLIYETIKEYLEELNKVIDWKEKIDND